MGQTRHRLHQEHLARLARMAANAKPDPGLQLRNGKPIPPPPPPVLPNLNGIIQAHYAPTWDFPYINLNGSRIDAPPITIDIILRAVCRYFNMTHADLLRDQRHSPVVRPRQIAMYLATQYTFCSLPFIAKRFRGMDHSTVVHARTRIGELIRNDPNVATEVLAIERLLGAKS